MTLDEFLRTLLAVMNSGSVGLIMIAAWDSRRHDRPGSGLLFIASLPPLVSAAIFGGLL